MKKHDLIAELAGDLKPVSRWSSPLKMTVLPLLAGFFIVALFVGVTGLRQDELITPLNLHLLMLAVTAVIALHGAALLALPGRSFPSWWRPAFRGAIALLFGSMMLLLFEGFAHDHGGSVEGGLGCTMTTTALTLATAFFGALLLRFGASVSPRKSGLLLATGALSLGWIGVCLHCGQNGGWHLLAWHFALPLVLAAVLAWFLGRKALKW